MCSLEGLADLATWSDSHKFFFLIEAITFLVYHVVFAIHSRQISHGGTCVAHSDPPPPPSQIHKFLNFIALITLPIRIF